MKKQINFNKVVSVFLVFCILLSMVPSTVKAEDSDVLYYILSEDRKTLTLTKSDPGEQPPVDYSVVENIILEEGMDRINQNGYCYNAKNVKMPNSLKTIGKYAFYKCTALTDINIPDSVTTIESHAFYSCESLKKIRLPESVTTIGEWAFSGCSNLTDINIPKGITTIGERAFSLCSNLTDINIPKGITTIEKYTFLGCRSLKNIEIPEGVVNIEEFAFDDCDSLESINIPQSVTFIGDDAFLRCTSLKDIVIPESVKTIKDGTFAACFSLENITIPDSVTRIESEAFYNCEELKSIKLSRNVEYIGEDVFVGCDNLTIYCYKDSVAHEYAKKNKLNYELLDEIDEIDENDPYTFDITESGKLTITINEDIDYLEIPEQVNDINVKSVDCINTKNVTQKYKIEHISFPGTLENIEDNAFVGCGIREISFPDSLITIGKEAFINNDFKEIEIPESVRKIEDGAFRNCHDLEKITIPHNVQIESNPFGGCYKLTIYCYRGYDISSALRYAENNHVPFVLLDDFVIIDGIEYTLNNVEKTAIVSKVIDEAIENEKLTILSEIPIGKTTTYTVTVIDSNAVDIDGITSLELPASLKVIKNNAFTKYTGDVEIPKNVEKLDINAFATHEVNITITEENENYSVDFANRFGFKGLYNKSGNVFYGLFKKLYIEEKYFNIGSNVTEIGDNAFKYCHDFKRIKIGKQVNKIGHYAFDGIEDQVIIVGYPGSYVERYAKQHNIRFENAGSLFFNWAEDNYSFNNNQEYFDSYEVGELINYYPNSLKEYANAKSKAEWKGSCEGMTITAILFKMGVLSLDNWQNASEKADSTYHLIPTNTNKKLKELINFYQLLQTGVEKNYCTKHYKGDNFEKFYDSVVSYYDDDENSEKKDDEKLLLFGYYYKKDEENRGHSVIITGEPQELDATFYIDRGRGFDNNDYYGHRIPIYDVNDCKFEKYVYIKNDFSSIALGFDDMLDVKFINTADPYDSSCVGECTEVDLYSISKEDVPDIETLMENNECVKLSGFVSLLYNSMTKSCIKDNKTKKEAIIEGTNKVSGELECDISPIYNSSADGENNGISEAYVSLAEGENYSVEPLNSTEPLDIKLLTKDSYMSVKTAEGGKATFENNKTLSLSNPSGKEFEAVFTVNDEYMKLPWYTIKLSGENSKDIKIESTEEGYVVTGDNLKNIKLTANNLEEKTELTLNTDTEKVLLKASKGDKELVVAEGEKIADVKEADLDVYEDIDNDGTFETKTQTATISNLTEVDAAEPEFENSQYDIDGNSVINTSDIVKLSHILIAPEKYADLKDKADLNSDGTTDVSDLLTLVRFMKQ